MYNDDGCNGANATVAVKSRGRGSRSCDVVAVSWGSSQRRKKGAGYARHARLFGVFMDFRLLELAQPRLLYLDVCGEEEGSEAR